MKIKLYVFEAIKNYAPDDILIISNQGGIEKGFVDKEMFEYKFDYISSALEDYTNISVYDFYCDNNDKDNINRKPNTGMIDQYMDYIKFINDNVDEENKIIYDTIMMIGDASGKEGQFSDSDNYHYSLPYIALWPYPSIAGNQSLQLPEYQTHQNGGVCHSVSYLNNHILSIQSPDFQ